MARIGSRRGLGGVALVGAALLLGGCPSSTRTGLVSTAAPPVWNITYAHGTIRRSETIFMQDTYLVRNAEGVIWQIDADRSRPECAKFSREGVEDAFPDRLEYGVTPNCYLEVVPAALLQEGQVYRLESSDPDYDNSLHSVQFNFRLRDGAIERASHGDFERQLASIGDGD